MYSRLKNLGLNSPNKISNKSQGQRKQVDHKIAWGLGVFFKVFIKVLSANNSFFLIKSIIYFIINVKKSLKM